MLAPIGGPVSDAQDQTSWYVNDKPSLFGPSQYWWAGDAGKGYGSNNYVYTYGIAGESSADNWARWSMGRRVGRQEIQVYVPNTRATATVLYRIDIGGSRYSKRVAQRNAYGWTALGTYNVDGASVTITLSDNDASQHWNRDGYGSSSIGVDAMAMRCVSRCSTTQPTPAPTATPAPRDTRSVTLSLGADRPGCSDVSKPCRWLSASYGGFDGGRYSASCYWSTSRSSLGTSFASFNARTSRGADSTLCWFNGTPGRYLTAVVDGVRSNTIQFAGSPPEPEVDEPSRPRSLKASPDEDTVLVSWSPPSDDGGAAVSGYRVDLYRGSTRVDRKSLSGSARSATFEDLGFDTAYRVRVSARNSEGYGSTAVADFRTEARAQRQQQVVRSVTLSLGADRAGCSDVSKPCRWLSASYGGFDGGRYSASCYWSTSRSSLGTRFASFNARTAGGADSTLCWFNGTVGRYLTAVVDGVRSNTIQFAGTPPAPDPTATPTPTPSPTPAPEVDEPSRPRSVRASADAGSVDVSWSAPSDDGGAAVSGYRVDLYRGSTRVDRKSLSASARSASFTGLSSDTAYQVRVSARNSAGRGPTATASVRTDPAPRVVRSVSLSLGADRSGCSDTSKPCRWLSASYGGFDGGRYSASCYWSTSRSSLGTSFASFNARTAGGADSTLCWFNGTVGRYLTAVVDGVRSNTIQFAGTAPTPDPTSTPAPTPAPEADEPSRPRSVRASADADSVDVSWSAPSDNGGAAVSGYRVDLYRGSTRVDRKSLSASARSASFTGLSADTAYQVRVSARNSAGYGNRATTNIRTEAAPEETQRQESGPSIPSEPRNVRAEGAGENRATVSWAPPASNGGSTLTGYQIELFRGSTFVDRKSTSASTRSTNFSNLDPDTAYTVLVSAKNSQGLSNPQVAEFKTQAAKDTRTVTITLGANRSGCSDQSKPCRWLSATYSGFAPGSYRVQCYSSLSPNNLGTAFASFTTSRISGTNATLCWYNGTPGGYVTAVVDGVRSNTIQFAGTASVTVPGTPIDLRVDAGRNRVTVHWSPPYWGGGVAVSGFRVYLWKNDQLLTHEDLGATVSSWQFLDLLPSNQYIVGVSARNSAGFGPITRSINVRVSPVPTSPRDVRVDANSSTIFVEWQAPSDSGGSPITGYQLNILMFKGGKWQDWRSKNVPSWATSTTLANNPAGRKYKVQVIALNKDGASIESTVEVETMEISRQNPKKIRASDYQSRDSDRHLYGNWKRVGTHCNRWGWACNGGSFYFTDQKGAYVEWDLGDMQGKYTLHMNFPKGKNDEGRAVLLGSNLKWDIFERRHGSARYELAESFRNTITQEAEGWRHFTRRFEVDGEVRIRVTVLSGYVGVADIKIMLRDVLFEHQAIALAFCVAWNTGLDAKVRDFLRERSFHSWVLGDEEDNRSLQEIAQFNPDEPLRDQAKGAAYELLIRAVARLMLEIYDGEEQERVDRIFEACERKDGALKFSGLGWTSYSGWGKAAVEIAETIYQFSGQGEKCVALRANDIDVGCLPVVRRIQRAQ